MHGQSREPGKGGGRCGSVSDAATPHPPAVLVTRGTADPRLGRRPAVASIQHQHPVHAQLLYCRQRERGGGGRGEVGSVPVV